MGIGGFGAAEDENRSGRVETARLRRRIDDCDAKLSRYLAALDAGGDPVLIASWIKETSAVTASALARLGWPASRRSG